MFKSGRIVFFLCLLFSVNSSFAGGFKLKGFIGEYPISMVFDIEPSPQKGVKIVKGEYSYDKYKAPIELNGRVESRYNVIISESTGTFTLERDWGCGLSELTGVWTSDSGKELPVKLSIYYEETTKQSSSGVEYKIIREINDDTHGDKGVSTYLLVGKQKVETDANCHGDVGASDVSLIKANNQNLFEVSWRVDSTAMGAIDDGNTVYLHANGDIIKGGVSGDKMGIEEYSKKSCDISVSNDLFIRTCIQESLSKGKNTFSYDEKKKVELFFVSEEGFENLAKVSSERGAEKEGDRPDELMHKVEAMPWLLISK